MKKDIRTRILDILIEPSTVTEIKTKLKDVESFGTIAYHLKKLESEAIVTKKKDSSKRGSPTTYSLTDKDFVEILKTDRKYSIVAKKEILKLVNENPMIEDGEITSHIKRSGLPEAALDEVLECVNDNLTTLHFKITKKGLKFLK